MGRLAPQVKVRIVEARGKRVMLDSDLATLYGVETKALLQQVRRNAKLPRRLHRSLRSCAS